MSDGQDARIATLERQFSSLNVGMAAVTMLCQEQFRLLHALAPKAVELLEERLREHETEATIDPSWTRYPDFWRIVRAPVVEALGMPKTPRPPRK